MREFLALVIHDEVPHRVFVLEGHFPSRGKLAQGLHTEYSSYSRHYVSEDLFNLRPVGVIAEAAEDKAMPVSDSRREGVGVQRSLGFRLTPLPVVPRRP